MTRDSHHKSFALHNYKYDSYDKSYFTILANPQTVNGTLWISLMLKTIYWGVESYHRRDIPYQIGKY